MHKCLHLIETRTK